MEINRQYIGARYVPKFYEGTNGTEWDENVAYEPLTIVTYLSNSYTSKIAVPASIGDPIHNPEYWASTGNYNAQVEAYRQDTIRVEGELNDLSTDVNNKISSLKTRTVINGGGSAVFCGDSYSDVATGYVHPLPYYINEIMHFEAYYNYSVAGAGFVNGEGTNQNFSGQLDRAISELTADEKNKVSYVFALGGQNDSAHSVSDIQSWLDNFITKAKTNFPNAKVVILPLWYNRALTSANVLRYQIMYGQALYRGCITDTMSWAYMINTVVSFMSDGVHPLETSMPYLASCIVGSVTGGCQIPCVDGSGVATFLTNGLDLTWASKRSYVDSSKNVHIKFVVTVGSTGIPANSPLFTVNDVYKPIGTVFKMIETLDGTSRNMMQLTNSGAFFSANTLNAGIYIAEIEYGLNDTEQ